MSANTKKISLLAVGIALFVVLSLCLQVPVFENYYLCLGYAWLWQCTATHLERRWNRGRVHGRNPVLPCHQWAAGNAGVVAWQYRNWDWSRTDVSNNTKLEVYGTENL